MKKILAVLPNSIAGSLIVRGFASGFRANGFYVLEKDFRKLTAEEISLFKPDMIFGYDYGFLMSDDIELKEFIKNYSKKCRLVHYFADEPDGRFAYVDKKELYEEYKTLNAKTFLWDKDFLSQIDNSEFLPLGVNTKAYRIEPVDKEYIISFVGRPLTDKRQKILAALIKHFGKKLNIFSYEKHFLQSLDDMKNKMLLDETEMDIYKSTYRGYLRTEKELARVYQSSLVNINITLQGTSSLNYRVFEVPASYGFLITDYVEDLEKNFHISRDLEVYRSIDDLIDKTEFYIKNQDIAEKIAVYGFSKVTKKHSYTARADMLLRACKFK